MIRIADDAGDAAYGMLLPEPQPIYAVWQCAVRGCGYSFTVRCRCTSWWRRLGELVREIWVSLRDVHADVSSEDGDEACWKLHADDAFDRLRRHHETEHRRVWKSGRSARVRLVVDMHPEEGESDERS